MLYYNYKQQVDCLTILKIGNKMKDTTKNLLLGLGAAITAIGLNISNAKAEQAYFTEVYNKIGDNTGYYETCESNAYNDCFEAVINKEMCKVNKGLLVDGSTLDTDSQFIYMECWELTGEIDYATDITTVLNK